MDSIALKRLGIYGSRIFDSAERVQKWDCVEFDAALDGQQKDSKDKTLNPHRSENVRCLHVSASRLSVI